MKARTVAEACHRQGNHDAALIETWPVIAALEALRRVGDDSFATDDTLRHFYVLNGLALCDKVSIICMETITFPLMCVIISPKTHNINANMQIYFMFLFV